MTFDSEFYLNIWSVDIDKLELAAYGGVIMAFACTVYYLFYGGILGMSGLCSTVLSGILSID